MYQPFRGQWVQNVAAFLSKDAATGEILSHLVAESICLLENHGFHVDVVTADGGQWNRAMWKRFGLIGLDASCAHPCRTENENSITNSRRLWFCSDFSHLIKNLRNFMMSIEEIMVIILQIILIPAYTLFSLMRFFVIFQTPDGVFKKILSRCY